jgi:hypothetical protein
MSTLNRGLDVSVRVRTVALPGGSTKQKLSTPSTWQPQSDALLIGFEEVHEPASMVPSATTRSQPSGSTRSASAASASSVETPHAARRPTGMRRSAAREPSDGPAWPSGAGWRGRPGWSKA